MAIILRKQKIFFVPAAKIACTSIKHFFFEIENKRSFTPFVVNGKKVFLHGLYKSGLPKVLPDEDVLSSFYRTTIVRDPVKRFLSAYSNRVAFHKELSEEKAGKNLKKLGLQPDPDIHSFIENFEHYRKANVSVNGHTNPMVHFLGNDRAFYDRVYCISEMEAFRQDIVERVGVDIQMPRKQTGGPKIDQSMLSSAELGKIKGLYEEDYAVYGDFIKAG